MTRITVGCVGKLRGRAPDVSPRRVSTGKTELADHKVLCSKANVNVSSASAQSSSDSWAHVRHHLRMLPNPAKGATDLGNQNPDPILVLLYSTMGRQKMASDGALVYPSRERRPFNVRLPRGAMRGEYESRRLSSGRTVDLAPSSRYQVCNVGKTKTAITDATRERLYQPLRIPRVCVAMARGSQGIRSVGLWEARPERTASSRWTTSTAPGPCNLSVLKGEESYQALLCRLRRRSPESEDCGTDGWPINQVCFERMAPSFLVREIPRESGAMAPNQKFPV